MPNSPSEEGIELIARIARQDKTAFSRFYDLYSPLAYTFAMRILRVRSDAEDLVQEIFVQAWKNASSYNPKRGKPEAWIITMTKSRAIDKIRSLRRVDRGTPALEELSRLQTGEAGRRDAMHSEVKLTVEGAMAGLSEPQRTVLEMAYFEGLTQSEIAQRLEIPLGTVKTRIRDGLKNLRTFLKTQLGDRQS